MTVIPFKPKPKREPHNTGDAICIECKHKWAVVVPEGVNWFECPACGMHKGHWYGPFVPPDDYQIFACNCGSQLFMRTDSGHSFCPSCGVFHDY